MGDKLPLTLPAIRTSVYSRTPSGPDSGRAQRRPQRQAPRTVKQQGAAPGPPRRDERGDGRRQGFGSPPAASFRATGSRRSAMRGEQEFRASQALPTDLLERAGELDVNVSRASERGVREEVQAAEARAWAEKNADFVAEMNARIERDGLPLEEYSDALMARFDLYNNPSTRPRAKSPFLLDVQSDHPGNLMSRVVIPLTRLAGNCTASKVAQDLSPINEIEGEPFVLETPLLGAVRTSDLGPAISTLEQERISAALDRLFGAY
ncbi:CcdB family protein [Paraburkholderia sp. CNPSo 3272]|uniref:CcdB family protein n=1 Tax=Paraburkholderia sp. CNPSo 3272 TaxID=2940931 RepID=UPI0020B80F47|nr:CcdB family protein [Paraburkholderia sp. CNPSo 3272]MCP3725132.1 CcdB family protein [Paraburkholderia sp. CNPSo 3272]